MKKLLLLGGLLSFSACLFAAPAELTTPQGKLLGEVSEGDAAVRSFKGIPYALPPTGQRRWKPAEPAPGWPGVRLANQFGPNCEQLPYAEGTFFFRPSVHSSEDCLYLNVWTAAKAEEKRPVMVWIHGGALTRGGGSIDTYNGAALAEKGVVVVTINYRLGALGYFSHPELTAESPHKASGNYGTSDQIQALKWVQDNIAAFGGDPDRVTIFGESAGSWSVHHLLASPLAKGLFHGAIGQSGAVMDPMPELKKSYAGQAAAESAGRDFAKAMLADMKKPSIADLRAIPAAELMAASEEKGFRTQAVVDGWIIPEQIYDIMAKGKQNPVPVIVGFNSDEGTTLGAAAATPKDVDSYLQQVESRYGEFADEYLELYPADDLTRVTLEAFRDGFVTWSMQSWAMMTDKVEQPAYLYYFTHSPSGPRQEQLGAYHAAEIQYVFDNYSQPIPHEQEMADIMSDYWVSFATSGDPNTKNRPQWKPYQKGQRHYLEFNKDSKSGAVPDKNPLPGVWEFYEKVKAAARP